jgi:hypothetical protein
MKADADAELRAEVAGLQARLTTVETLLRFLHGDTALGGSKPPPAEPPPAPPRMRPIATIGPSFWGGSR